MSPPVLRYVPSQADVAVFEAISSPPSADLCHALRWYNHIKSYQDQKSRWGRRRHVGVCGCSQVPGRDVYKSCLFTFQSPWCEEASGSVWPRECGRHHVRLCSSPLQRWRRWWHWPVRLRWGKVALISKNTEFWLKDVKDCLTFVSQDDEETTRLKEERLAAYAAKKAKSTLQHWASEGGASFWLEGCCYG